MTEDTAPIPLDHAGYPARLPDLTLPHPVDPHVYRLMQETVRLLNMQNAYAHRVNPYPVTLSDLEHSARRSLTALVGEMAAMLDYESERMASLGAPSAHNPHAPVGTDWTRTPLPPGMTRSQALEQSTAYGRAASLVRGFLTGTSSGRV